MRICIPSEGKNLNSKVGEHFGRAPYYIIFDLIKNEMKVIPNMSRHMGGEGYPPEIMNREGIDVLVCRNLGRRALNMFKEFRIDVYVGAEGTVRDAIKLFQKGELKKAEERDACVR